MKIRRWICLVLTLVLMLNLAAPAYAKGPMTVRSTVSEEVYVDGVAYTVEIDEDLNITVSAKSGLVSGKMVLDKSLKGTIVIQGNRSRLMNKEYDVSITDLDAESELLKVDLVDTRTKVKQQMSYTDVVKEEYVGQAAITAGGVITVGGLLAALLYSCLAIVIAGTVCYAVDAVLSAVKNASSYYYKAYRRLNTVFINPNPISQTHATNRIRSGADTYTYTSWRARTIVANTGLGVTRAENHWEWYKIGSYYWHYHTGNRNGAHSFYGAPR